MSPRRKHVPIRVHVRMYRVGFGDAFLLTFDYAAPPEADDARKERHVLVDCGTTHPDDDGPKMIDVVTQIAADCGGQLDVLVVTHRHKDHLSAFGDETTGAVLDGLAPRHVVRPWTDDPRARANAVRPVRDRRSRQLVAALDEGAAAAARVGGALGADGSSRGLRRELRELALDQVKNRDAIDRLERYAHDADAAYVAFGEDTRIEQYVPGVDVEVLGPPTVAAWPEVTKQRSSDADEFWMLDRGLVTQGFGADGLAPVTPEEWRTLLGDDAIGPARWLLEHLDDQRVGSLLRIVRTFDDTLNNTSLILLFTVGQRRLLFSGDAQIENWSYALHGADDRRRIRELLSDIDLYKVGHHGSRNATPKSLFKLWEDHAARRPMVSLLSTLHGVHGTRTSTAVPRATLVNALTRESELYSTDDLADGETHVHLRGRTDRTDRLDRLA